MQRAIGETNLHLVTILSMLHNLLRQCRFCLHVLSLGIQGLDQCIGHHPVKLLTEFGQVRLMHSGRFWVDSSGVPRNLVIPFVLGLQLRKRTSLCECCEPVVRSTKVNGTNLTRPRKGKGISQGADPNSALLLIPFSV